MMFGYISNSIKNSKGVALLLAVTVITLLVAVTVQFSKDMRQELIGSANYLASNTLGTMVKSGYNIGAALLQADGENNKSDTFFDNWAQVGSGGLANLYGSGNLSITISDVGGRIQLNSLVDAKGKINGQTRDILKNLFNTGRLGEYSAEDVDHILYAIIDWIDPNDDEAGIEETESSYYLSRQPSYKSKNGPLEFIEELLLIRGITSDLYYGNTEFAGLKDLVTVHGNDGKININTAPPLVLQALHANMSEELVEDMIEFRDDEENKGQLDNANWYKGVLPGYITIAGKTTTVSSNFFKITATAERNNMKKNLYAVVQRQSGADISMIFRKVE